MTVESVEIVLKPAYRKFNYLYVPASQTKSFPAVSPVARMLVTTEAEGRSWEAELQHNSKAHV